MKPTGALLQLFLAHPLKTKAQRERLAESDLEYASEAYLRLCTYHGDSGPWHVWLAIEESRGHSLEVSLSTPSAESCRWLAAWFFGHEKWAAGVAAYSKYLEFQPELVHRVHSFLLALHKLGREAEVLDYANQLDAKRKLEADSAFFAAQCALVLGRAQEALDFVLPRATYEQENPVAQAHAAIVEAALGRLESALPRCLECARLGLSDESLLAEMLQATSLSEATYGAWLSELRPPPSDILRDVHVRPGSRIVPSQGPSPHRFGGNSVQVPPCPVCGQANRLFFALSVADIPELKALLPGWNLFPMLGCTACLNWFARHDYKIDGNEVSLLHLEARPGDIGGHFDPPAPDLSEQAVCLVANPPGQEPSWEFPQVGGDPNWAQDEEFLFCKLCRRQMVFIAAMATASEFEPEVFINNGSGFQYHFACAECRTIAVLAQWT